MPIVGLLVSRLDARYLIAFGFVVSGLALLQLMHITLTIDFRTAMSLARVPERGDGVSIRAHQHHLLRRHPQEQNNQVSGIVNLMRNVGGSIGISAVTTLTARRSQAHQQALVANIYGANPTLAGRVTALSHYIHSRGASHHAAVQQAYGEIFHTVQRQAAVLSYVDTFWILAIVCFAIVRLIFVARHAEPGQAVAAH